MRRPRGRGPSAPLWIVTAVLVVSWPSTAQLLPLRRQVEAQTALAAKAREDVCLLKHLKEANASGAAELRQCLEQERERAGRLENELAAARRDLKTALAAKAGEEVPRLKDLKDLKETSKSCAAEPRQSLEQERERAGRLEDALAAARRDLDNQAALAIKASEEAMRVGEEAQSITAELQQYLEQEHGRAERLENELAAARRGLEARASSSAKADEEVSRLKDLKETSESSVAELQQSLQQERERAGRLESELAGARRDLDSEAALAAKAGEEVSRLKDLKETSESSVAELQQSLQQERERAGRLENELVAARHDLETQTVLLAKVNEEASRSKQATEVDAAKLTESIQKERERADALARDLSTTRSAMYAYEAQARKIGDEAAELRQAVAKGAPTLCKAADERERTEHLQQDLATARRDLEKQAALTIQANAEAARIKRVAENSTQLTESLRKEHERSEELAQQLSATHTKLHACEAQSKTADETRTVAVTKASDEAPRMKQAAEPGSAGLRSPPPQERYTVSSTTQDVFDASQTVEAINQVANDSSAAAAVKPAPGQTTATDDRGKVRPNPEEAATVARLVARASVLLGRGDIGGARFVLERADEMGSAQASFALAETYDPLILSKWGAYGTRGDADKARDLYAKAEVRGIKEAKARFEALRR